MVNVQEQSGAPKEPTYLRVVVDDPEVCPYLPEQTSRMPLCIPTDYVTAVRMDELLELGYRRSGRFFYRTQCPRCVACEPIRVNASSFKPTRSQRRAEKKGDAALELRVGAPIVDVRRINLFNIHRSQRKLDHGGPPVDEVDYRGFLLDSPVESVELSFWHEENLIAISILDVGATSFSAVYCFFDPAASTFSPGTYSIMKQLRLATQLERPWLYLGLYVEKNSHLNYKAKYGPHQRRIGGKWIDFD